ncbi:IS66 family insertion sequence element accessory protein TnpB [Lawsonibacter hominis]|uniref:IS66 family insertion sequence element accessory protein TnpB n=1 Tax=Lawsonibacter hominis TaxID=2763053 RepID=UPI003320F4A6
MLNDFSGADKVYIACGYTDLRKSIDGFATLVEQKFKLEPFSNTLFLFCGRRRDRIKGLYWGGMASFFCISVWSMVNTSSRGQLMKFVGS